MIGVSVIDFLLSSFNQYLPQILAVIWAFVFIAVILLSYFALKNKTLVPKYSFDRFKSFKKVRQRGKKRPDWTSDLRIDHYEDYYKAFKGLFLVHTYEKPKESSKHYNIFIYISGDESKYLSHIARAEFMFGPAWNNHIFPVTNNGGVIGISTTAAKPFLCTCCVVMRDGRRLFMDRYIDFEVGKYF